MTERHDDKSQPTSDDPQFHCEAWGRRAWKCTSQCDNCFRKQYESRLVRSERLLREFITTCDVHKVTSKTFFDLWSDVEGARVYFRELPELAAPSAKNALAHIAGFTMVGMDTIRFERAQDATDVMNAILSASTDGKGHP